MAVLVTGGAGYIGSHTCLKLLEAGYEVVVVDNLLNSSEESLKRVEELTGKSITFYQADVRDQETLDGIFEKRISHPSFISQVSRQSANPLQNR